MIKRKIQDLTPSLLLEWYKTKAYQRILTNHDIGTELDIFIAKKLLENKGVFVDIGANIGLYTKYLSPLASSTICFEPVPFTFKILKKNVKYFNLQNVSLHPVAISENTGVSNIEVPIQAGVFNYFRASLEESDDERVKSFPIQTQTLDSFFEGTQQNISFIKCDVEQHELSIIRGASSFLQKFNTPWLIEVSGNPDAEGSSSKELFEIMSNYGFTPYFFDGSHLLERIPGDNSVNYFFLKPSSIDLLIQKGTTIVNKADRE